MPFGGRRHPRGPAAALVGLGLVLAACGSSTEDEATSSVVTVEAVAASTTAPGLAADGAPPTTALVVGRGDASDAPDPSDPTGSEESGSSTTVDGVDPSDTSGTTSGSSERATTGSTTAAPPPPTSGPDTGSLRERVVGTGSPASCTSRAVVDAVAAGGYIRFDCGPDPVSITLDETAKVVNANGPEIVLDGGGLVTLSGGGSRRILYLNTCDQAQGWTTSHCNNQDHPRLTVQNLTFADGNATGETIDGGGGGAIFVRGGQFRVVNSRFVRNRCDVSGPDVGGAAIRVLSQFEGRPVEVVGSTFGGAPGQGGVCSNGGALSSIGVSWRIVDSVFSHNRAIGNGANPARTGTPGGGSGGAIYTDGNRFTVEIIDSIIEDNDANEGGGAVFFVSNDRSGTMSISGSTLRRNPSAGFETSGFPGIFFLGARDPTVTGSTLS